MSILGSLAIIILAGLIHASFQLSVSMLTLLSGHAIGRKSAHTRVLSLGTGFLAGTAVMTILLLSTIAMWLQAAFQTDIPLFVWAIICGFLLGLGIAVWAFYYRREPGTSLWLPRGMARYLLSRTKATRHTAEAFSLGMSSVIAELLFIIGPLMAAGLVLIGLDPLWQFVGLVGYTVASSLSLVAVIGMIGGGQSIGTIQHWREANKGFLQFVAGSGLIILGFYMYVSQVGLDTALAKGGL